jgi:hypothetical protein
LGPVDCPLSRLCRINGYYYSVTDIKTEGNPAETLSDRAMAAWRQSPSAHDPLTRQAFYEGYAAALLSPVSDASLVLMGPEVLKRLDHLDLMVHQHDQDTRDAITDLSIMVKDLMEEFAPLARRAAKLLGNPVARHLQRKAR